MVSFRKEKVNKMSQASPAPLVKNKKEKRKRIPLLFFVCLSTFCLLLSSCKRRARGGELPDAPKEEQRLMLYTFHKDELWKPIVKEFEERTGIWVRWFPGGRTFF